MKLVTGTLLLLLLAAPARAQTGRWITQSGNLEINIAPCGAGLCGTAVKVLANHSMSNPGTEMGGAPALGLVILRDFVPAGENLWRGQIYDRENGKTYRCEMSVKSPDELSIHPYIGIPLFGQTQIWRRAVDSAAGTESMIK